MPARKVGNRYTVTTFVTPETYHAIERQRGLLKRSTYCALMLERMFNPANEKINTETVCSTEEIARFRELIDGSDPDGCSCN